MFKKIVYILLFIFLVSCGNTFDSVKKGLTGEKRNSADEFLVKKKDPLILPPDFENLPSPDERSAAKEQISIFENSVGVTTESTSSSSDSIENSILKKIQKK